MSQKDMIGLVLAMATVSIIVRLLLVNPMFGVQVNETANKLFG
jgi:hypothetical protein